MDEKVKSVFLDFCKSIAPSAHLVFMNPKEAVFEECVKMNREHSQELYQG